MAPDAGREWVEISLGWISRGGPTRAVAVWKAWEMSLTVTRISPVWVKVVARRVVVGTAWWHKCRIWSVRP